MDQVRILHIINIGGFGGAEKLLTQLLPALADFVETECLLCFRYENSTVAEQIGKDLTERDIRVHLIPYKKAFGIKHLRNVQRLVKSGNYSIVHSHLQYANLWMAILKKTRQLKITVLTTLHGYRDSYQNKYGLLVNKHIFRTSYYWITRFILRNLDGYIFISNCLGSFFIKAGLLKKGAGRVIHHGYSISNTTNDELTKTTKVITAPRIVLPGRIIKLKGHIYALGVLDIVRQKYPEATLHFFGAGPFKQQVLQEVSSLQLTSSVFFHGYVHELLDELREYDIAVIPSFYESFGMVFLDCFAARVPVVAFDLPAGNEIIEDGCTGLLAKPFDTGDLAQKVMQLCEDAQLQDKLIKNGWQALHDHFSMNRMAADYAEYYQYMSQPAIVV